MLAATSTLANAAIPPLGTSLLIVPFNFRIARAPTGIEAADSAFW
jgi:hypothetical protein